LFKRILLLLTAFALVGAYALPALAQEAEEGDEEEAACTEVLENVQELLTEHEEGEITAEEAAAEVAEELESAAAEEEVGCTQAQLQELTNFIEQTPSARDVAEILSTEYAPAGEAASPEVA
jgi:hypothetical protein